MSLTPHRRPVRRVALVTSLAAATLHLALPALAGPGAAAPVAAAALVPASAPSSAAATQRVVRDSLVCDVVDGLRLCSHGDDEHLASSGGGTSSTSSTRIGCYGDGRSGPRVQAVYARRDGAPDRLASMLPSFRGWAGAVEKAVDDSAHKTGGARHVRFATVRAGTGCSLSVLPVALPASAFASFSATVSALRDRGLDRPWVKYLVWADATGYCGVATTYRDDQPGADNLNNSAIPSYARVDSRCWGKAETHEVVHMLGGVQPGAPNATDGMHCSDGADVMCYDDGSADGRQRTVCAAAAARLLDCGSDDYFSTSPRAGSWLSRHWNTASSAFLSRGWTDPAPAASPSPSAAPTRSPSPAPSPTRPSPKPSPKPTTQPLPLPLPVPLPVPLPTLPLPLPTLPVVQP